MNAVDWVSTVFRSVKFASDKRERSMRFLEEAAELVQPVLSREEAHALIDQVYDKPVEEELWKEFGGALHCLILLAHAHNTNLGEAYWKNEDRVDQPGVRERIAQKWYTKAIRNTNLAQGEA